MQLVDVWEIGTSDTEERFMRVESDLIQLGWGCTHAEIDRLVGLSTVIVIISFPAPLFRGKY